jgi:predicted DsbA family dithiol-disulfide isomerase
MSDAPASLTVFVWADVVCPWCCLGKAHLDRALEAFAHRESVNVEWRSFELDPNAPRERPESLSEHLAARLGRSIQEVDELQDQIRQRGLDFGIDFRFDIARTGNTFDAHRLLHLAKSHSRQGELATALYRAYFTDGQSIGQPDVLREVAMGVGLDAAVLDAVLESDAYADHVRADEEAARSMKVTGVPFFVFDGRLAAGGAQPPDVLLAGLEQAWATREVTPSR